MRKRRKTAGRGLEGGGQHGGGAQLGKSGGLTGEEGGGGGGGAKGGGEGWGPKFRVFFPLPTLFLFFLPNSRASLNCGGLCAFAVMKMFSQHTNLEFSGHFVKPRRLDRAPSNQTINSLVPDNFPPHFQSILSVALVSVGLPSSNLWMTVEWSGHLFTRPLMAPRRGFLSGSVALVEHPLRFLTFLRWVQRRALSIPFHPPSCLTDPLAAQCVSASPVSVWYLPHRPPVTRPIGSRMVLYRVSTCCMGGLEPVLQVLGPSPGSSAQ